MACPSGCLNGGGQLKPRDGETAGQLLQRLDEVYHDTATHVRLRFPGENPEVGPAMECLAQGKSGVDSELSTVYHKREKTVGTMVADW